MSGFREREVEWRELKARRWTSAISLGEMVRYRELLWRLLVKEFQVRYRPISLGIAWTALQPIMLGIMIAVPLSRITGTGTDTRTYLLFVLVGLLSWTYFNNSVQASAISLIESEILVKNSRFPRVIIPLSIMGSKVLDLFFSTIFLILWAFLTHGIDRPGALLWLPLISVWLIFVTASTSMAASALCAEYRELRYLIPFILQGLFFLCPVLYSTSSLSGKTQMLIASHPLSVVIELMRSIFLASPMPEFCFVVTALLLSVIWYLVASLYFVKVARRLADIL